MIVCVKICFYYYFNLLTVKSLIMNDVLTHYVNFMNYLKHFHYQNYYHYLFPLILTIQNYFIVTIYDFLYPIYLL